MATLEADTWIRDVLGIDPAGATALHADNTTKAKAGAPALLRGAKRLDVQVIVTDWDGEPMRGFEGILEFKSPGAPDVTEGGEIRGGVVSLSKLPLMEQGTLRFLAISRGEAQLAPEGVVSFKRPAKGLMTFSAVQQFREVTVTASTSEEAARTAEVSGTAGVDYKVFKAEGTVSSGEESKKGQGMSVQWTVRTGKSAFTLTQT